VDGVIGATAFLGLHRQRLSVLELLGTVTSARGLLCDNADERGVRFSSPTEPDVDDWFGSKMWNGDGPKASPAVWDHAGFIGGRGLPKSGTEFGGRFHGRCAHSLRVARQS
jgi:hypothetical protein